MMTSKKFINLAVMFSLIACINVFSQQKDIKFEHISIEEGLSQSGVNCILQDSKSFLWFGTGDGLNKYDGYKFDIYKHDPDKSGSLSNNDILAICEDQAGNLWIGTRRGLNRFNRSDETFTHWLNEPGDPNSLSHNHVLSIYEDQKGFIWIGTKDGGLNKFEPRNNRFKCWLHDPDKSGSLSNNDILAICEDRTGNLWIGTRNGLNQFDHTDEVFTLYSNEPGNPHSLSHNEVLSIVVDQSGTLWIGTRNGLNKFDHSDGTFTRWTTELGNPYSLSHNEIRSIFEDGSGTLWIGTWGGGINRYDRQNKTFSHWVQNPRNPASLSDNSIYSIYEDRSGVLWIGTVAGINKFDPEKSKFVQWTYEPGNTNSLSNKRVFSVFEDRSGVLWIGTVAGLNRFDRQHNKFSHWVNEPGNPNSLSDNYIRVIFEDRAGTLWIGTDGGGINSLNRNTETFTRWINDPGNPESLSHNSIRSIHEDNSGVLWVGTVAGLNRFDRQQNKFDRWINEPRNPNSLSHDHVRTILEDRSGTLWIGTYGGGLNEFDRECESFTYWINEPGNPTSLSKNEILSIYEDSSNVLWIGTYGGGLNKFDREKGNFINYREKDGLPNDVIYGILEDDRGDLWLSSNRGLSKFNPRAETFKNYDMNDGLQGNEFNSGAYYKNITGILFFGGVNGLTAFQPETLEDNTNIPPIVITSVSKFDDVIKINIFESDEIQLHYTEKYLSFEFSALDYRNPQKNKYAYTMEGFDEGWIQSGTRRFVPYTYLDPGKYTFRVKGSNNDGVWNEKGVLVNITITPPFWQTWWFRIFTVLFLSGMALFGHKIKVKSVEAQNLKLETRVAARTSEIAEGNRQLQSTYKELKDTEYQLAQTEKMASLGTLAAGVVHDINSPIETIKDMPDSSSRLIDKLTKILETSKNLKEIKEDEEFIDTLYVLRNNNFLTIISSEKIARIIQSLKNFVGLDEAKFQDVDIHDGLDSTLALLHHEMKNRIEIVKEYGNIPKIHCFPNQINQVFMNVLTNAFQAIKDKGTITIKTQKVNDKVIIRISDDGKGIEKENLKKIFDPRFTTKREGVGTGLGLSISKKIIKAHSGEMEVRSEVRKGTEFSIILPIKQI
jgi:ligand-binding sensor domain-containing protein/signal transduction histidine kinase